jgi:hypothetical protein
MKSSTYSGDHHFADSPRTLVFAEISAMNSVQSRTCLRL